MNEVPVASRLPSTGVPGSMQMTATSAIKDIYITKFTTNPQKIEFQHFSSTAFSSSMRLCNAVYPCAIVVKHVFSVLVDCSNLERHLLKRISTYGVAKADNYGIIQKHL